MFPLFRICQDCRARAGRRGLKIPHAHIPLTCTEKFYLTHIDSRKDVLKYWNMCLKRESVCEHENTLGDDLPKFVICCVH